MTSSLVQVGAESKHGKFLAVKATRRVPQTGCGTAAVTGYCTCSSCPYRSRQWRPPTGAPPPDFVGADDTIPWQYAQTGIKRNEFY